jgi:hypothetical protein
MSETAGHFYGDFSCLKFPLTPRPIRQLPDLLLLPLLLFQNCRRVAILSDEITV